MRTETSTVWVTALAFALCTAAFAGEAAAPAEPAPKPAEGPPIPLHSIEGVSGVFITNCAYFANMPAGDAWFGKPSVALSGVHMGHKSLYTTTVTTNFFKRVELGYSFMHLELGDWDNDVEAAVPGVSVRDNVQMHTLSARLVILRDSEGGMPWVPALTAGVHYKNNTGIWDINRNLGGVCNAAGVRDNDGFDFTLTASKLIAGVLPRPFILSAGLRSTEAAQIGLVGFTGDRDICFEGNAVFFVTDRLLLAAEYRQKPDNLGRVGRLCGPEHDWWTLAAAYVVNNNCTVAAGYGHFGNILNHEENAAWALQAKWEF